MAFKHRILFATYLAANFGCYRLRITPDIVLRQMNDQKIERSNRRCFGRQCVRLGNNFSPIPSKISFHMKKKWLVAGLAALYLQSIKTVTLLTLELSQYSKSGSMFSSSKPVAASSKCSWLRNTLCLCLPVRPRLTRARGAGELPRELGSWFCTLNLRLSSGTAFREIARWQAGAQTWIQTWTLPHDQRVVKVL